MDPNSDGTHSGDRRSIYDRDIAAVEQENGRLKRAPADAMVDNQILKELNANKW